ncbi:hypothetical protein FACS1894176_00770 [Bacteroidia bacterium]|nr:hypothetical protein FACS1894176_00770 [Bacteroidia bacterium]
MILYYELGRDLQFIFLSRSMAKAQRGFTLIEVVVALTLFAFVIVGIITAVNRAYAYVQQARLNVIAMNLTREGMEMMYNIRDTNRKRRAGLKDQNWGKANPFDVSQNSFWGETSQYTILPKVVNGQDYFSAYHISLSHSCFYEDSCFFDAVDNGGSDDIELWRVKFSGDVVISGTVVPIADLMEKEGRFYRVVKDFAKHDKQSGASTNENIP